MSSSRLCVVCGMSWNASQWSRGDNPCGSIACTLDMTESEAWMYWRDKAHKLDKGVRELETQVEQLRLENRSLHNQVQNLETVIQELRQVEDK